MRLCRNRPRNLIPNPLGLPVFSSSDFSNAGSMVILQSYLLVTLGDEEVPESTSARFHECGRRDCSLDVAENSGIHFFCVGDRQHVKRRSANETSSFSLSCGCQTVSRICLHAPG